MAEVGAMFDEFVAGGGGIEDGDVTVVSARFGNWDYRGKSNPVLGLNLKMTDAEGQEHDEWLSAGDLKFFVPSADGKKALPVGTATKLNASTNAAAFILSLFNADTRGEFVAKMKQTDDISVLDGIKLHVSRKAAPKRSGILVQPGQENRAHTQLTVDKVLAYPGEAGAATPAAAAPTAAAAPAAAAAGAPASGLVDTARGVLMSIIAEAGGSIKKTGLASKVLANADMKAAPVATRNAVLGMIVRDDFLTAAAEVGIKFDPATGTVSLG